MILNMLSSILPVRGIALELFVWAIVTIGLGVTALFRKKDLVFIGRTYGIVTIIMSSLLLCHMQISSAYYELVAWIYVTVILGVTALGWRKDAAFILRVYGVIMGVFALLGLANLVLGRQMMLSYYHQVFNFNPKSPIIFTDFYFWLFFALVMCVFSAIHQRRVARSTFLFAISIFFYWKTSGLYFLLLIFATLLDYFIGIWMEATKTPWKRKALVGSSVFINLTNLIYFKYSFFFTDAANKIFANTHLEVFNVFAHFANNHFGTHFDLSDILLPVGVSFFTFQSISYSVEVFRGEIKAVRNILDFGFYVSYFPQLVAGPIVRANEFVPQIYQPYKLTRYEFGLALFMILNGLIKKLVVGDYIAVNFIDRVFDYPENYTGFGVLSALLLYSLQVYADFSGYTDIAIGVSLFMGFRLPTNFNSPYKAQNVTDFWRRWHMSLSTWLKNYLYIPLGGNKKGTFGTVFWSFIILLFVILISDDPLLYAMIAGGIAAVLLIVAFLFKKVQRAVITNINLLITMILGGLWHGASWNFVIWGALNGAALVFFKTWEKFSSIGKLITFIVLTTVFAVYVDLYSLKREEVGDFLFGQGGWTDIFVLLGYVSGIAIFFYVLTTRYLRPYLPQIKAPWGIFITFVFISFTRLFFRAGDRKNTGNGMETVDRLWDQLMLNWDGNAIVKILNNHWQVFALFVVGMVIHWLPVKVKDWYRGTFASAPGYAQAAITVLAVLIIYQFMSSDLQAFIYFQF